MTIDLSHLAGPVKEQAFQDAKRRVHLAQTARWVGFARAQMAVDELEKRYYYPTCARMPCMLLYGDSGMGKTMILEKMERQHPSIFRDSDVFICRPLGIQHFFTRDKLNLRRRRATTAEQFDFDISTHDIIGSPLYKVTELFDYIYSPSCFRKSTGIALLNEFEQRGHKNWIKRFLKQARPSESNLLGYEDTVLETGAGYEVIECEPDALHHSIRFPGDRLRFGKEITQMVNQPKQFGLIQSTVGIDAVEVAKALSGSPRDKHVQQCPAVRHITHKSRRDNLLLQVRCAVLDRRLDALLREPYPNFRLTSVATQSRGL